MQLFDYTSPKMIVADRGKHIRKKTDNYEPAYVTPDSMEVEAHYPYYATTIFVPDTFTEEEMYKIYIEEDILVEEEAK